MKHSSIKFLSWCVTLPFLLAFGLVLGGFDPLLRIAKLINGELFNRILTALNGMVLFSLRLAGVKYQITIPPNLPLHDPVIIVCNHQSMFDIPLLMWHLRRFTIKFIAKKELSRGIPSVSFALRNMGSLLIDRKDPKSAIPMIEEFGRASLSAHSSIGIFPEGTRAKDGLMKKFKVSGILALLRASPETPIVPVVINGSWRLVSHRLWPIPFGITLSMKVFPPLQRTDITDEALFEAIEQMIQKEVWEP